MASRERMLKKHEIKHIKGLKENAGEDVMFVPIPQLVVQGNFLYKYSDSPSEAVIQPDEENAGRSGVCIHKWSI